MQIQPTQSYLYCSIHEGKNTGGILLPQGAAELQPYATVILVGPACKLHAPGDFVLFTPANVIYADENKFGKFVIVPESAVFAKYLPEEAEVDTSVASLN